MNLSSVKFLHCENRVAWRFNLLTVRIMQFERFHTGLIRMLNFDLNVLAIFEV